MNDIRKDKAAIDEIKRDRDDRLNALRNEIEELNEKHDDLIKDKSALDVKHHHQEQELERYQADYMKLTANLNMANNVRQ